MNVTIIHNKHTFGARTETKERADVEYYL